MIDYQPVDKLTPTILFSKFQFQFRSISTWSTPVLLATLATKESSSTTITTLVER
jgi:hypothetical protein